MGRNLILVFPLGQSLTAASLLSERDLQPADGGAGCRGSRGFTLIELVVVLAILAIVAAFILPAVGRGAGTLQLRSEAGRVAALLREARQHAVTHGRATRVVLDPARSTLTLTADDPDHPLRALTLPPGVRLRVAVGAEALTFSTRGRARETRWVLEGSGGRRLAITVGAVSGRVTVGAETLS